MKFNETPLKGAYTIELEKFGDDRGFFARFFCKKEYEALGLDNEIVQINNSLSKDKGTLRGLHYQLAPKSETKIVRCVKGALYDVILDLREGSETFGKWFAAELTPEKQDNDARSERIRPWFPDAYRGYRSSLPGDRILRAPNWNGELDGTTRSLT